MAVNDSTTSKFIHYRLSRISETTSAISPTCSLRSHDARNMISEKMPENAWTSALGGRVSPEKSSISASVHRFSD
jgi:hypothetical protein